MKRTDKEEVSVTVPQNVEAEKDDKPNENDLRESLGVQAILAEIGAQMGFQIWLPRADRIRGQEHLKRLSDKVLDDYEEQAQETD